VSEFVQSALDGFNVCLFSCKHARAVRCLWPAEPPSPSRLSDGQTGSGKTHTMQGEPGGDQRGIIPRAIEQVLSTCLWGERRTGD
jgi:kinesin family protein C1